MSENTPWLCICGKTNRGPACSNCGKTDDSGHDELMDAANKASSNMRANSLGFWWANSSDSSIVGKVGCLILILMFLLPTIFVLLSPLLWQRN
ncbi:MAG: hypothetical protein ACKVQS_03350 [Fimbriimonadaceae bacterium]